MLHLVAAGTELGDDDPFILYWDLPLYTHSSTHSDDITTISFHPVVSPPLTLSGSSDGLLTISNAKRCYTSVRGALASPRQAVTARVPMHRHRPLATWFSLWSDELDQLLSSNIRSPSVHTQSRTWVTDYLIACLPLQEGLRLYVGSNEYAHFPGEMQHSSPHLVYRVLNLPQSRLGIGSFIKSSHWYHSLNITQGRESSHGNRWRVIQMWKDTPLDSLGFKDVDGDVEMMIAPEAYPLSCNNRKRNHDEDQTLTGKGIAIYQ